LRKQLETMRIAIRRWLPQAVMRSYPGGGYFIWLEFPGEIDAMALHRLAIAEGISITPGPIFSASRAFRNCIRLNCGHPWSTQIEDAIRALGRLVPAATVPADRVDAQ
jgi:DNA-binding transcriptional MocR family regulator